MASYEVFILSEPATRGVNAAFYCMNKDKQVIEATIYATDNCAASTMSSKIKKSSYMIIKGANLNSKDDINYMRLQANTTKVFKTGKTFNIPDETLTNFYKPAQISIPEALVSPKKRKLSVEAEVHEVKALKTGSTWKRRDVTLLDPTTTKKITVKLWNSKADSIQEGNQGATARLTNFEVDIFNNHTQLKSLDISEVEINAGVTTRSGDYTILGVDSNEDILTIITSEGPEFEIERKTLEAAGKTEDQLVDATPIKTHVTITHGAITSISFL